MLYRHLCPQHLFRNGNHSIGPAIHRQCEDQFIVIEGDRIIAAIAAFHADKALDLKNIRKHLAKQQGDDPKMSEEDSGFLGRQFKARIMRYEQIDQQ